MLLKLVVMLGVAIIVFVTIYLLLQPAKAEEQSLDDDELLKQSEEVKKALTKTKTSIKKKKEVIKKSEENLN